MVAFELVMQINILREQMHQIAVKKGLSDLEVLKISQQIDEKVNQFFYLVKKQEEKMMSSSLEKIV